MMCLPNECRPHFRLYYSNIMQYTEQTITSTTTSPGTSSQLSPEELLHSVFGFTEFRPPQDEIIATLMAGREALVLMPTGGGKSVVLDTLEHAMLPGLEPGIKIVQHRINPKAQTVNQLYGVMDPVSRDWQDGVLSRIFRALNQPLPPGKENEIRWIIYDGDVDALWIENMNSVSRAYRCTRVGYL